MSSSQSPVKNIIFDLGNVLVNYDTLRAAREFSRSSGVSILRLRKFFMRSAYHEAYVRGEITCEEFYEEARKSLKLAVDFDTFRAYWNGIFWENEGMEDLVLALKPRYPLYLISNTNRMHFDYIKQNYPVLKHFRELYASHEVGIAKPDPRIYEKVVADGGLAAGECLFIDDQKEFVEGARKAGMRAVVFKTRIKLLKDMESMGIVLS